MEGNGYFTISTSTNQSTYLSKKKMREIKVAQSNKDHLIEILINYISKDSLV